MSTLDLLREVVEEEEVRRPYFIEVLQIPLRPFLTCRLHLPVAPAGKQTTFQPFKSRLDRAAGTLVDDRELLTFWSDTPNTVGPAYQMQSEQAGCR